jgi:3-keto-5-aminohexanoate cleavage enzyme
MPDAAILTCALTGVLTHPEQHPVPVTPAQMAAEARDAFNAGASIMHVHLRRQAPGQGHLPSWEPDVAEAVVNAIRAACPGVIINLTTGVVGTDISGPVACLRRVKPEAAACNAGSLNYLKLKEDGTWAWPPMVFDNPVEKVQAMLDVMNELHIHPEFECFDVGIVRSVGMYLKAGMFSGVPELNFVMGVASGMPCDADLLALLPRYAAARRGVAEHADRPRRDLAGAPEARPNSAACCAPGWKTPSTCPAARAPAATA